MLLVGVKHFGWENSKCKGPEFEMNLEGSMYGKEANADGAKYVVGESGQRRSRARSYSTFYLSETENC